MAEFTNRSFNYAMLERGPVQLNIPRDHFYGDVETKIPGPQVVERSAGGPQALREAAELLASAKNPVIGNAEYLILILFTRWRVILLRCSFRWWRGYG